MSFFDFILGLVDESWLVGVWGVDGVVVFYVVCFLEFIMIVFGEYGVEKLSFVFLWEVVVVG